MSFKEQEKRLAGRKKDMNALLQGIEAHEKERNSYGSERGKFSDPKYAAARASMKPMQVETSDSSNDEIRRMFETDTEKTKTKNAKKTTKGGLAEPSKKNLKVDPKKKGNNLDAKENTPKSEQRRFSGFTGFKSKTNKKESKTKNKKSDPMDTKPATDAAERRSILKSPSLLKLIATDTKINIETEDSDEIEEEGFLHIIEALSIFQNMKYIFMQQLLEYTDIEAVSDAFKTTSVDLSYQILSVNGQLLFLMQQQKIRCSGFIIYSKKAFVNVLYDTSGSRVLKYIGPSVVMSKMTSRMVVADAQNRMLGYIKPFGTKVNYSVYNAIGERLFLVVSNLYVPTTTTDFSILCRGQKIGTIKTGWKHTFHDLQFIDYETSGIEFPIELDEREKALLLGCLMLIEFFWYSPLTRLKLSLLIVGIIILTLAIIILCIPIITDNPGDDGITKSYYVAENLDGASHNAAKEAG